MTIKAKGLTKRDAVLGIDDSGVGVGVAAVLSIVKGTVVLATTFPEEGVAKLDGCWCVRAFSKLIV